MYILWEIKHFLLLAIWLCLAILQHITIIATVYLNNDRSRPRPQTIEHSERPQGPNIGHRFSSTGVTPIFSAASKLSLVLMTAWYSSGISTPLAASTSISGIKMLSPMLNFHLLATKSPALPKIKPSSFGPIILKEIRLPLRLTTHLWGQSITPMTVISFWLDQMTKLCTSTKLKTKSSYLNWKGIWTGWRLQDSVLTTGLSHPEAKIKLAYSGTHNLKAFSINFSIIVGLSTLVSSTRTELAWPRAPMIGQLNYMISGAKSSFSTMMLMENQSRQ